MWKINTRYRFNYSKSSSSNADANGLMIDMIEQNGDGTFTVVKLDNTKNPIEFCCGESGKIINKHIAVEEFGYPSSWGFMFFTNESYLVDIVDNDEYKETKEEIKPKESLFKSGEEICISRTLKSNKDVQELIKLLNATVFE